MNEKDIALRLSQLRKKRDVSARDMSLSIGQNPSYINNIETGKTKPSLDGIILICEYFGMTLSEFFDIDSSYSLKMNSIINDLKKLDDQQLDAIEVIIKGMAKIE